MLYQKKKLFNFLLVQVYDDIFCFPVDGLLWAPKRSTTKHEHLQWVIQILDG